jgi:hypothetical protein
VYCICTGTKPPAVGKTGGYTNGKLINNGKNGKDYNAKGIAKVGTKKSKPGVQSRDYRDEGEAPEATVHVENSNNAVDAHFFKKHKHSSKVTKPVESIDQNLTADADAKTEPMKQGDDVTESSVEKSTKDASNGLATTEEISSDGKLTTAGKDVLQMTVVTEATTDTKASKHNKKFEHTSHRKVTKVVNNNVSDKQTTEIGDIQVTTKGATRVNMKQTTDSSSDEVTKANKIADNSTVHSGAIKVTIANKTSGIMKHPTKRKEKKVTKASLNVKQTTESNSNEVTIDGKNNMKTKLTTKGDGREVTKANSNHATVKQTTEHSNVEITEATQAVTNGINTKKVSETIGGEITTTKKAQVEEEIK